MLESPPSSKGIGFRGFRVWGFWLGSGFLGLGFRVQVLRFEGA